MCGATDLRVSPSSQPRHVTQVVLESHFGCLFLVPTKPDKSCPFHHRLYHDLPPPRPVQEDRVLDLCVCGASVRECALDRGLATCVFSFGEDHPTTTTTTTTTTAWSPGDTATVLCFFCRGLLHLSPLNRDSEEDV